MNNLERRSLSIGFVPLTDCAPLVIAREKGFFARRGLEVELSREASWASVRDRLAIGAIDAAQLLAPMPISMSHGLAGLRCAVLAPMVLDLNGNAITVSTALHAELQAIDSRPEAWGATLRRAVAARQRLGRPRVLLAHTYPFSTHHYLLRYWLKSAGLEPGRDLDLVVIPPPQMAARLAAGQIDGYCVGEPWNQLAVRGGSGRVLLTSHAIWNNAPEKVLGVTAGWAEQHPGTLQALITALIEAAAWLDRLENRLEAARLLASEQYVDAPLEAVAYPLLGYVQHAQGMPPWHLPDAHVFHRYAANYPWVSQARWFAERMQEAGHIEPAPDLSRLRTIFRPDLYRTAARSLGLPCPDTDTKVEGLHDQGWTLPSRSGPISLGADHLIDGATFDPST